MKVRHLLTKAINEGIVTVKLTRLSISGAPASGKSSLQDLLLDKPPRGEHHSTAVAGTPIRSIESGKIAISEEGEGVKWEKVDYDALKKIVAEGINEHVETASKASLIAAANVASISGMPKDSKFLSFLSSVKKNISSVLKRRERETEVSETKQEMLSVMSGGSKSDRLYNVHWIYTIDTGGQAAFQDVAPAFLRMNSLNIITVKLSEKLESHPQLKYSIQGKEIGQPKEQQLTNLQLTESLFRSLSSIQPSAIENVIRQPLEPKFMVLGTFADHACECPGETLARKNEILNDSLRQYAHVRVDCNQARKEVIVPVNTQVTENREQEASLLREKIMLIPDISITALVPVKWFMFELEVNRFSESIERKVISLSECYKIGKKLSMSKKNVKKALKYFHSLTMMLYFPDVLPHLVFFHPQPLVDKVSEVISLSFAGTLEEFPRLAQSLPPNSYMMLKTQGLFTRDLFQCLPIGFVEAIFSPDDFLILMEYLNIVAVIPGEERRYFIPCVLPVESLSEKEKEPFLVSLDPLVITWGLKPIPQGLFPALIVHMLTASCNSDACRKEVHRQRFHLPRQTSVSHKQLHNAISLVCDDLGGSVLFVDAIFWLEIYYSGHRSNACCLHETILTRIGCVVRHFNYKPVLCLPQVGFVCSVCDHNRQKPHPCLAFNSNKTIDVRCSENEVLTSRILSERQTPWLLGKLFLLEG